MTKFEIANRRMIGWPGGLLGLAAAATLAVGIVAGPIGSGTAQAADSGEELSMEEIVDIVNAQGLGTAYEVEAERGGYEVKVEDSEGVRHKLYVDSRTGDVLHQKRVDDDDDDRDDD